MVFWYIVGGLESVVEDESVNLLPHPLKLDSVNRRLDNTNYGKIKDESYISCSDEGQVYWEGRHTRQG